VASFLGNITLDTETVSNWAYEVGSLKRPAAEVAAEWIAANEDRVNGWLGM
jgi:glycine betaine/proline transport system substrate-binding protein